MGRCRWVRSSEVPGGKFWLPECWGGLYGPEGCYCPPAPRATKDELANRISALEKRVQKLEAANG